MFQQTVWIARHGNRIDFVNPEWFNTAKRPYDPHLSDDGVVQAQQLAKRLIGENITQIFASPFLRTVQTANEIAKVLDLAIKLDWGLCEWLNPKWMPAMPETLSRENLAQTYPRIDLSYDRGTPKYPETWKDCMKRTGEVSKGLVKEFPTENILLVGHGVSVIGTAAGLVGEIAETELKAPLCCLVKIVLQEEQWVMELSGDTSHLDNRETTVRFV
ncbi:Phosphoglycerate mutase [Trichodesmium erythraeum IMS101]|uniref:Phosphoglycerate mutase n=1 Tax=Trichodesmium erythraeum (strain IMS101) TaxID=203124 RepID=Q113G3_TRIEI|nr:histidine phosphatase family protein [Trichodesmium erythraeum GBRTRLIN201]MCH2047425.1 histidine phosphatase family protein [Trichodesmium sp. ALOHA_ZT_67]MDE5093296.1 histidine phosphatase family protein [Trichodesmium sp. St11_bin5]MDT9339388.1 histidine phosphatase family protein [Trichodesmium erythraeum 21-75]